MTMTLTKPFAISTSIRFWKSTNTTKIRFWKHTQAIFLLSNKQSTRKERTWGWKTRTPSSSSGKLISSWRSSGAGLKCLFLRTSWCLETSRSRNGAKYLKNLKKATCKAEQASPVPREGLRGSQESPVTNRLALIILATLSIVPRSTRMTSFFLGKSTKRFKSKMRKPRASPWLNSKPSTSRHTILR